MSIDEGQPTSLSFSASAVLGALRRRLVLLVVAVILCPTAAYGITTQIATQYQAQVLIEIRLPSALINDGVGESQLLATAQVLAATPSTQQAARRTLPAGRRLGTIAAASDVTTGFVVLTATAPNAQDAAATANAYATATVAVVNKQSNADGQAAVTALAAQIAGLARGTSSNVRDQLEAQLAQLSAEQASGIDAATVTAPAQTPGSPSEPQVTRSIVLGALIGLLLGLGLMVVAELLDRRFHSIREVEGATDAPVLATIPSVAFTPGADPYSDVAFARLRSNLTTPEGNSPRTVMVVSGGVAEGKTTVSINLARAFARAGQRVVLLETDLRRPMIASRLGVAGTVPLPALLAQPSLLPAALTQVPLPALDSTGSLQTLPCGGLPPNPAELLASPEMMSLIGTLREQFDVVVIDSSPLLAVPDPLPLIPVVDTNVVVVRLDKTRRDRFLRASEVVTSRGGVVSGLVITNVRQGDPYYAREYKGYYVGQLPAAVDEPGAAVVAEKRAARVEPTDRVLQPSEPKAEGRRGLRRRQSRTAAAEPVADVSADLEENTTAPVTPPVPVRESRRTARKQRAAERDAADREHKAVMRARKAAEREAAELERAERETAKREAREASERETAKRQAREASEREARERAEREAVTEREARERAEREVAEEREAREQAQRDATAEREARERDAAERAAAEAAERETRERLEREAAAEREKREQAQREAAAEREARERAERDAQERGKQEAAERAEREAADRAARDEAERAERERLEGEAAAEREAREQAQREAAAEREAREHAEREAAEREAAARDARDAAEREAAERVEREAREKEARDAAAQSERERLEREAAAEREAREQAEREVASERAAREATEREAREQAEREAVVRAEREVAERAERERLERAAADERAARERAEREAAAEREARAQAQREADERIAREATERAEREAGERQAREVAEREAREQAEREAAAHAEREVAERAERERLERAAADERAARERAEREAAAEREARELAEHQAAAEREARERAEREAAQREAERAEREAREEAAREAAAQAEREAAEEAAREAAAHAEREAAADKPEDRPLRQWERSPLNGSHSVPPPGTEGSSSADEEEVRPHPVVRLSSRLLGRRQPDKP